LGVVAADTAKGQRRTMDDQSSHPEQDAGSASPHLDEGEQGQAAAHAALRPLVVHEIVREEGETALNRTAGALAWSGLAAGLSMGFSFLTQSMLHATLPATPWRHALECFGYSVGFLIVILGRQQLFTESTLTAVLPVLVRRDMPTLLASLRLWAIVLVTNLVGSWIFAGLLLPHGVFQPDVIAALEELAKAPTADSFVPTLLKAMFAGWLIATMVWLLPSARSARIWIILIVTYVVSLGRLSHIIAGSVEAAYAVLTDLSTSTDYCVKFLVPTLIGNTLGGVSLVALLNHAAIAPDLRSEGAAAD
jgi:formate/nitrite transporter FocA (FNT family)